MSANIRYPNINASSEREQIGQIRSYLHQLVDQLNYALSAGGGNGDAITSHTTNKNNPHGVTAAQVGAVSAEAVQNSIIRGAAITNLNAVQFTVPVGGSVKFRISNQVFMIGRVTNAQATAAAVYAFSAYNENRAPLKHQISEGSNIGVSINGDNDNGYYIQVDNSGGSDAIFYLIGNTSPKFF